jgi:3-phenylpropionate/trans-cinnamate dioxygenase ferredoxin reductase component
MNVADDRIVIAGGGLAAVRTAQALRDLQYPGPITLLSAEDTLPYDRPPLSKAYLIGKLSDAQIRLLPAEKLSELNIDTQLSRRVVALDRVARRVTVEDGSAVDYGRLVVATGARPVRLPQLEGMNNVHVLREAQDARRLRESLAPGTRMGIVGAGFIGLEIAATALGAGCDVTLIELSAAPLAPILGAELGACIQRWHERKGIRFHCGTGIASVRGDGRVQALALGNGALVEVDQVVVGVGQVPNVEWLAGSGLTIHRGLVCDVHGRTEDPSVFGVGDVVCTRVGESFHPTRQWTAVTEQARRAAYALRGKTVPTPVIEDNYFWSDQHGLKLQFAGQVPADPRLVWLSGGPDAERFAVLLCTSAEVTAVFSLGCPREFLQHSMPLRRGEKMAPTSAMLGSKPTNGELK